MSYIVIKRTEERDVEAGLIHITEIRRESEPTTKQYEFKWDEPIPEPASIITKYEKLELPFDTARADKEFTISGSSVVFLSSDGTFEIRFGDVTNDALTQDDFPVGSPLALTFEKVFVTNAIQAGKKAKFLIL